MEHKAGFYEKYIKRLLDFTLSAVALIVLSPVLLVTAILVRIKLFAPLAFGVYLIHDHPAVRPLLWQWLNPAGFAESPWMLPYALLCVAGIFVVCCMIEWLRQQLFRVCGINKLIERGCGRIQNRVQVWLEADV